MEETAQVYKVVESRDGQLVSAFVNRWTAKEMHITGVKLVAAAAELEVKYVLGEAVKPKIGKLFAFTDMQEAKIFCTWGQNRQLWLAEATKVVVRRRPVLCMLHDILKDCQRFWGRQVLGQSSPLRSTVLCSSIKLLERVSWWKKGVKLNKSARFVRFT